MWRVYFCKRIQGADGGEGEWFYTGRESHSIKDIQPCGHKTTSAIKVSRMTPKGGNS